jgi:hypothetical protein
MKTHTRCEAKNEKGFRCDLFAGHVSQHRTWFPDGPALSWGPGRVPAPPTELPPDTADALLDELDGLAARAKGLGRSALSEYLAECARVARLNRSVIDAAERALTSAKAPTPR